MQITVVDVFTYTLTYAHGEYVMSGGRSAREQTAVVVRLTAGDHVGWGEVAPLGGTYLPAFPGGILAALDELAPLLIGVDASNRRELYRVMDAALLEQRAAKSAVDIAAWDLFGRHTDQPIAALLGGVASTSFALYEAVALGTPEQMRAYVGERLTNGITRFQLKVGNDPQEDVARVSAVVEAFDGEARFVADANGGWNVPDAREAIRALEHLPIYIEQPCRTLVDSALAMTGSRLPLVLDECVVTLEDLYQAKHIASASVVNIKLSRVGGLTKAALMRDAAQDLGLRLTLEDTWGGDIVSAAVSHLAASTRPAALHDVSFFNDWTSEHIAGYVPRSTHGRGSAPTGSGLGIVVDESQLTRVLSV